MTKWKRQLTINENKNTTVAKITTNEDSKQ